MNAYPSNYKISVQKFLADFEERLAASGTFIKETCPWCGEAIWGTVADIDSGVRRHREYCEGDQPVEVSVIPAIMHGKISEVCQCWNDPAYIAAGRYCDACIEEMFS